MKGSLAILLLLCTFSQSALAHEIRPAFLEIRQTDQENYAVLWKVPSAGDNLRLGIYVTFPGSCSNTVDPRGSIANGAWSERWTIVCTGGLSGQLIGIAGLSGTATDVLVRLQRLDGSSQVTRLTPSSPSFAVEAAPQAADVARTYVRLGVEHILTGIDHLLFVLALIIITGGGWKLVMTVTAFTISHSITLTLATLGFVHLPQAPVEAVIALSILFVACEIIRSRRGQAGLTERSPWMVALAFGLLHGLGFAGALSEVGLPQTHIPVSVVPMPCRR